MVNQFSKRLKQAVSNFRSALSSNDIEYLINVCLEIRSLLSLSKDLSVVDRDNIYTQTEQSQIIKSIQLFAALLTELQNNFNSSQLDNNIGIKIFLNSVLPIDWNIYSDCLIIDSKVKNAKKIAAQAKYLGQKHIYGNFLSKNVEQVDKNNNDQIEKILNYKSRQCICIYDDENSSPDLLKFYDILKNQLMNEQIYERTLESLKDKFVDRMLENIDKFLFSEPVNNIKPLLKNQHILIISPGPSLKENIKKIQKFREDYVLIAVAQACPLLSDNDITPDYIIVVDAIDYSISLKSVNTEKVKGLIVSTQVHRSFLNFNFQKIYFWESYNSIYGFDQFLDLEPIHFGGGSVSINALSLALYCTPESITIVGQDLVLGDTGKYSEGISYEETGEAIPLNDFEEINGIKFICYQEGSLVRLFDVLCIDGKTRLSPQDYYMYLNQLEELVSGSKIKLINLSEQGAVIQGFSKGDLVHHQDAMSKQDINQVNFSSKNYRKFLLKKERNLKKISKVLQKIIYQLKNPLLDINILSDQEKKLQALLIFSPEVNNIAASNIKKIERLTSNSIENTINSNIEFSLVLYRELSKQVKKLTEVNRRLIFNLTKI